MIIVLSLRLIGQKWWINVEVCPHFQLVFELEMFIYNETL